MQAIDFQDAATVNALLQAKPSLARIRFINPFNRRQLTFPVHFAAQLASRRDTLDAVQILNIIYAYSDKGPSDERSAYDQKGRTPLHLSVTGPSSRATAWLLDKDEGLLHVEDSEDRTALHCCASAANCDVLLKRGAVVDHADKQGLTALHTAIMALIEAEVPINELDVYGDTASHIAVRMARTSILRILIRHGADLSIRNSTRQTPKDLAKSIEKSAVSYGRWAEGGFSGLQGGARDESNGNARDDTSGRDEVEDSDGESLMPRGTSLDRILFGEGPEGQQENNVLIELSADVVDRMGQVLNSLTKAEMMTDYILERCREDINKDCRPKTRPKDLIRKLGRAIRLHNTEACKFVQTSATAAAVTIRPLEDLHRSGPT
ncbi:hypothetical protein FOFC_20409 [Fusarium oxysporum]|nr:hypothetical protein FOFC_20409 [Fusarium oxysporum]